MIDKAISIQATNLNSVIQKWMIDTSPHYVKNTDVLSTGKSISFQNKYYVILRVEEEKYRVKSASSTNKIHRTYRYMMENLANTNQ